MPRYGPVDGNSEMRSYAALMAQSFAIDADKTLEWARGLDVRVLRRRGVEGGLALYTMGQYFGGRSVPAWGVAGVAVPPHLRGGGLADEMLAALLREMYDADVALSPLYPATNPLYSRLGWEAAGSRILYELDPAKLALAKGAALTPISPASEAVLTALYARMAAARNGNLDRNGAIWRRVLQPADDSPLCGYLAGDEENPTGYLLYVQKRHPLKVRYEILVRDLVWENVEAGRALLTLLARHSSMVSRVLVPGAPNDPLLRLALHNADVPVDTRLDWMLRIVCVKQAFQARGYPPGVSGEAVLNVHDGTLPGNSRAWKLKVRDGNATAQGGGRGGAKIDIGGLAALYSGFRKCNELRALGQLSGPTTHDALLDAAFAGSPPWIPDFF
jgi:predicted acetyltransferase